MSDEALFHPVANIFPLMGEAELDALAEDIRANGLRYPIWHHRDGRVVDGRNRWLACQKAAVECPSEIYEGPDGVGLVAFVVSLNEKRRHLTESQRARLQKRQIGAFERVPGGGETLGRAERPAELGLDPSRVVAVAYGFLGAGELLADRQHSFDGAPGVDGAASR